MRTLTKEAMELLDYLKKARDYRYTHAYNEGKATIGTIFHHGASATQYIITNINTNGEDGKVVIYSVRHVTITGTMIDVETHQMYTSMPTHFTIDAFDGVDYLQKLATENTKKDILLKQIKETEDKIAEMKKEVNTL